MGHLEMVRAKSELRRSRRMVRGLGKFINWKESPKNGRRRISHCPTTEVNFQRSRARSGELRTRRELSIAEMPSPGHEEVSEGDVAISGSSLPIIDRHETQSRPRRGVSFTATHDTKRASSVDYATEATSLQEEALSEDVRSTFQRAADIVRKSVEVDGAMFVDASVGTYGGLIKSSTSRRGSEMFHDNKCSEALPSPYLASSDKPCVILGSSIQETTDSQVEQVFQTPPSIGEAFLQSLLSKYPQGKIWSFDESEDSTALIDSETDAEDLDDPEILTEQAEEETILQRLFPGVRSLAFVGMWDSHRDRWFAGSIVWTFNPTRFLIPDVELRYLTAFGQTVMAETARLDAWTADRAKATFISSISHELRTPLHGILGSAECLHTTDMDTFQSGLLTTIETCGKTLLETFDNLLSFAKINNLMTSSSTKALSTVPSIESTGIGMGLEEVDVNQLTEEVVETVFAGHEFRRQAGSDSSASTQGIEQPRNPDGTRDFDSVRVVVDYDELPNSNWIFKTQPGGWRRIVMNLVGNSLKYTDSGSVMVKLAVTPIPGASDQSQVTLTVKDTGRGISREFLESQLFSPFVQEDPLAPGTGLGLSIVKQLVTGMGGTISVESEKNRGTETTVSIPMTQGSTETQHSPHHPLISSVKAKCHGLSLNVLDTSTHKSSQQIFPGSDKQTSLQALCASWLGTNIICSAEPTEADVYIVTESQLQTMMRSQSEMPVKKSALEKKSMIVLCKDSNSLRNLSLSNVATSLGCCAVKISQPYTPTKLARAFASCSVCAQTCSRDHLDSSRSDSPALIMASHGDAHAVALNTDCRPSLIRRFDSVLVSKRLNRGEGKPGGDSLITSMENIHMRAPAVQDTPEAKDCLNHMSGDVAPKDSTKNVSITPLLPIPSAPECGMQNISVLLVDDNRINLQLLSTFVKKQQHYRFETAMDGLQAFQTYQAAPSLHHPVSPPSDDSTPKPRAYDFVLMDVNMPIMDGLESTRQIRAFEQAQNLQPATIIALTGMASASARQEAFASGIDLFLTKPVRLKELTSILEKREFQK